MIQDNDTIRPRFYIPVLSSVVSCFSSIISTRFSEDSFCEIPKKFSKSHIPGTEMTFIAVAKLVPIVFRHVMFFVTLAVTSLKIGQNL